MHKLSYKTLLIIFFSLLIAVVVLWKFVLPQQKIKAAWWNDSWQYRKAISVANSSGSNLTDFQVSLSVGTSALIASGKMKNDCSDIRITDQNGKVIPHWIEENNPGCNAVTDTKIWIKAPLLPTSGAIVYIYYGNSSATSVESGDQTFEFFDDFDDGSVSDWTNTGSGTTNAVSSTYNDSPPYSLQHKYTSAYGTAYKQFPDQTSTFIAEYSTLASSDNSGLTFDNGNIFNDYNGGWICFRNGNLIYYSDSGDNILQARTLNIWYRVKLLINPQSQNIKVYINNSAALYDGDMRGNITTFNKVHPSIYTNGYNTYFDNIRVRKYASADPTLTLQSEEVGTAPIAYWKFDEGVGTTTLDSSNNSNTGTIVNAVWAEGKFGKSLNFNGGISNDYAYTFFPPSNPPSSFTAEVWINADNINGTGERGTYGYTIMAASTDGTRYPIWITLRNGEIRAYTFSNSTSTYGETSGANIQPNQWYHIAVSTTQDGTSTIYINGISKKTFTAGNTSWDISDKLTIADLRPGRNISFDGYLDDLKIYPYARTAAQIKMDYNSRGSSKGSSVNLGVQSNTAPDLNSKLTAYWKFDEGNGTITYDSSPQKTNITLTDGPTWNTNGKFNKSLTLDGLKSRIQGSTNGPTSSIKYTGDNLTISLWFKPNSSDIDNGKIFSKPWNGSGQYNYNLNINSDKTLLLTLHGNNRWQIATTDKLIDGKWNYISLVLEGSTQNVKIYINNKLSKNTNHNITDWTPTNGDSNLSLVLGCYYPYASGWAGNTDYCAQGEIDEFKIYNSALSDDEVKQDYNQGSAISFGSSTQTIGATTTSLEYCIPGDTSPCSPPIAEWKMDEGVGTTAYDISGNNTNISLVNNPLWVQGKIGKAIQLNGSNQRGNAGTGLNAGLITAEAWLYRTSATINQGIIRKQFAYAISLYNNTVQVAPGNNWSFYNTGQTIPLNTWTHLAWTYDGSYMKLYKNGILVWTSTILSGTFPSNSSPIWIGYDDNVWWWGGKIDHFKIYDYARTAAQIAYDYNKGGPVGWWKFDECQGNTVYDWSGIGNTGTISIGASGTQNSIGTCQVGTSAAWINGAVGKINSSLNFDGVDDYVDINNNSAPTLSSPQKTVAAWINVTGGQNTWRAIVSHVTFNFFHFQIQNSNKIEIYFYGPGKNAISNTLFNSSNYNKWFHVVGIWDGTYAKIYINGVEENRSTAGSGAVTSATSNVCIGNGSTFSRPFNGQIDDVRIYNYALTAEQIKILYNGGGVNFN